MSNELEPSIYETDPVVGKKFKSKRLPDMHGGLSTASATPDQRLEMQGVMKPKSEIILDKVYEQKREFIHGRHGPSASLPVLVNILNNQVETLKTLKEIKELLEFKIPIGQMRAFKLSYSTAGFTHIEFTESQFTVGVPSGQVINEPQRKLYKLRILNDGPADIQFSANIPRGDRSAEIILHSGETDDSLDFQYPIIWSLNIATIPGSGQGGSSNTVVRVFYVY